jgi:hypothetical protein
MGPLVNNFYLIEKFPGKGGWTYVVLPEIPPDKRAHFGWVRVKGTIDNFEIRSYHLMPMGNGKLFLPIKSEIRKKIGKQEGDTVHVILYADNAPTQIPEELVLCLKEEPKAYEAFLNQNEGEKKAMIDWIYSAKQEDTKIERIAKMMNKLNEKGSRPDD